MASPVMLFVTAPPISLAVAMVAAPAMRITHVVSSVVRFMFLLPVGPCLHLRLLGKAISLALFSE